MDNPVKTNPSGRPSRLPFDLAATRGSLFHALLDARGEFGGGTPALVDGDGRVLTYDELVRASFALGHALRKGTKRDEKVGVMLPTGVGSAVAFLALTA
ncbi:MAG TPA: AMP-binding protein, partial [Rhizomicrobium sp.]|nr:AMP-binding protein [Rhizomicrobium sp.]